MSAQIPGAAQNFNISTGLGGSYLTTFCRAGGDQWPYFAGSGSTVTFNGNTIVATGATIFDLGCLDNCSGFHYVMKNNLILGYTQSGDSAPGLYYFPEGTASVASDHMIEYGIRNGDACTGTIICSDPLLTGEPSQGAWPPESVLDAIITGGFYPTSMSLAIGAGMAVSGWATDYYGTTLSNPPPIGAVMASGTPTAATPTFSPCGASSCSVSNPTVVTASTATSGCGSYIYFDANPTPTTNQTTYTVTAGVTLYAYVHGCPGYADSGIGSAVYSITASPTSTVTGAASFSGKIAITGP
jgi:hypothetical protein